jgi:hypothetical protein
MPGSCIVAPWGGGGNHIRSEKKANSPGASSADLVEPSPDLSRDFVDLVRTQKGRLLFQFRTPSHHNMIRSSFPVIAFINNLLDRRLPFVKTHRLFLSDCGVGGCLPAGKSQPEDDEAGVDTPAVRASTARHLRQRMGETATP